MGHRTDWSKPTPPYAAATSLSSRVHEMLSGVHGEAKRLAMHILVRMAGVYGAHEMIGVTRVHIDGCLYAGDAGLEFTERLVRLGGQVCVPTTLNVAGIDLCRWRRYGVSEELADKSLRLARACEALGARPTWTCAPYQEDDLPNPGEHVAWSESNAIVFANSVLGARTDRYGDMFDICAALTGYVPLAGLQVPQNRRGQILVRIRALPERVLASDGFYPLLGYLLGKLADDKIPVIEGLPAFTSRDQLKALCAAAASSGSVAMFHAIGVTPEAPDAAAAFQGYEPERIIDITEDHVRQARQELCTARRGQVGVVALGCPHFSLAQFRRLIDLLRDRSVHPDVQCIVSTGRTIDACLERESLKPLLERLGIELISDTCILNMPVLRRGARVMVTDSGKYAHYAPGMLGIEVIIAPLEICVEAAVTGRYPGRGGREWNGC